MLKSDKHIVAEAMEKHENRSNCITWESAISKKLKYQIQL